MDVAVDGAHPHSHRRGADRRVRLGHQQVHRLRHPEPRARRRHVRLRDPVLRHHDRRRHARSDHRSDSEDRRNEADAHRDGHDPARAARPSRRIGRGDFPRHDPRDAAALRAARHRQAHSRLRGLDGGGRQFSAVDWPDDPRVGLAEAADPRDLQSARADPGDRTRSSSSRPRGGWASARNGGSGSTRARRPASSPPAR